jgi:hypothetical protein
MSVMGERPPELPDVRYGGTVQLASGISLAATTAEASNATIPIAPLRIDSGLICASSGIGTAAFRLLI